MLLHGNYGVGKSALLGDMLKTEGQKGPVGFINIAGEDGFLSMANLGLGEIGETVDTLSDLKAALGDFKQKGAQAVGIDGGKQFGQLIIKSVCGDKLPSVGKGSDDWSR